MFRPMRTSPGTAVAVAMVAVTLAACQDKPSPSTTIIADAAASKLLTADPKIEMALKAAASAAPANDKGPPPEGIFAPGVADRRHAKGAPTTVDVVNEGDEPRVTLTGAPAAAEYGPAGIELGMQMGPRVALPTVDLTLTFHPAKKDDGGADWLVADVKKSQTAKEQLGELPPGTDAQIAALAGSQVRIKVSPDGMTSDAALDLVKGAPRELDRMAQNALESLILATVPLPPRPVGVGAQWIAESRMPMAGLDVVAYRAYRVTGIKGERLQLSFQVKGYAATDDPQFPGVPAGAKLVQVNAEAQGELELVRGEYVARKSDMQEHLVMIFKTPGTAPPPGAQPPPDQPSDQPTPPPPGSELTAQIQSQATLVRGADLLAAMRSP
jgi:hypothetical protein